MNIVIHGCGGRMGRILTEMIFEENEHKVLCGIDIECIGDLHIRFTGILLLSRRKSMW